MPYEILEKLGQGGMAEVFLAVRRGSSELCVIKRLHTHLMRDEEIAGRMLREAELTSMLRHPAIARLIDAGRENGRLYLAFELVPGKDLDAIVQALAVRGERIAPGIAMTTMMILLEALSVAHELSDESGKKLGLVHRDLSSRNIMLSYEGDVKLIDFGIARAEIGSVRTAPGTIMGTLRFMSPEQAFADPIDARADLYSLAVVLYEMLSGRALVRASTPREILAEIISSVAAPISSVVAGLPAELDAVLARGMAKNREERFASAAHFGRALLGAAGTLLLDTPTYQREVRALLQRLFGAERVALMSKIAIARAHGVDAPATRVVSPTPSREETRATEIEEAGIEELSTVGEAPLEAFEPTKTAPSSVLASPSLISKTVATVRARPPRQVAAFLAIGLVFAASVLIAIVVVSRREETVIIAAIDTELAEPARVPRVEARPLAEAAPIAKREEPREEKRTPVVAKREEVAVKTEPVKTAPVVPKPARDPLDALLSSNDADALRRAERMLRDRASSLEEPLRTEVTNCIYDVQSSVPRIEDWGPPLAKCARRMRP